MDVTDLVTQQEAKQAEFEVDDKSGVRVVAKHDGKVLADLIVGKGVGAGTMVRLCRATTTIWQANGINKFIVDKPARRLARQEPSPPSRRPMPRSSTWRQGRRARCR